MSITKSAPAIDLSEVGLNLELGYITLEFVSRRGYSHPVPLQAAIKCVASPDRFQRGRQWAGIWASGNEFFIFRLMPPCLTNPF